MVKIYLASPLFSESERMYNDYIYWELLVWHGIGSDVEIYLPQDNETINDKDKSATSVDIAKADTDKILESDLIIAVLDGQTIDPGVAAEIGIAYAEGIPVIGLYTDSRTQGRDSEAKIKALQSDIAESQFSYLNLFVVGLIKQRGTIVSSIGNLANEIEKFIEEEFE